jgi:transposase
MRSVRNGRNERPTPEWTLKEQAVRLVLDEGKSVTAVARELDLVASALGNWVKQARAIEGAHGSDVGRAARSLTRLRREVRILEEERTILEMPTLAETTADAAVSARGRDTGGQAWHSQIHLAF